MRFQHFAKASLNEHIWSLWKGGQSPEFCVAVNNIVPAIWNKLQSKKKEKEIWKDIAEYYTVLHFNSSLKICVVYLLVPFCTNSRIFCLIINISVPFNFEQISPKLEDESAMNLRSIDIDPALTWVSTERDWGWGAKVPLRLSRKLSVVATQARQCSKALSKYFSVKWNKSLNIKIQANVGQKIKIVAVSSYGLLGHLQNQPLPKCL